MEEKNFTKVTPEIESLAEKCRENNRKIGRAHV